MTEIIGQIQKTNPNKEGEQRALIHFLETQSDKLKARPQHYLSQILNELSPDRHSLPMSFILSIKSECPKLDAPYFCQRVEFLLKNLNPVHLRPSPYYFGVAVHKYAEIQLKRGYYNRGIQFIEAGLKRFRPNKEYLTPLHADVLCLCLKSKNYMKGASICKCKISDIDTKKTGCRPVDMLRYFYYGGMIQIGLKCFEDAIEFFETGLSVPALAFNAIQIETFKKNVLVNLLLHGKYTGLPKNCSQIVHRHMKTYCNNYVDFANAFAKNDVKKMEKILKENEKEFKEDNNIGLIGQCRDAFHRRQIQKLTLTYVTISLDEIAKSCKMDSPKLVEKHLLKMVETGEVCAKIDQKNGMVSFVDEDDFDTEDSGMLLRKVNDARKLSQKVQKMDRELSSSVTYIARRHGIRDQDEMFDMQRSRNVFGNIVKNVGKMFQL